MADGERRSIGRRAFIIGSAVVAGGVAFGLYKVTRDPKNPLREDLPDGAVTFNPWVVIDANGITLIAPHTDFGQGARSMQAMLIAEELDVDLEQCTVSPGVPSAAYWNTASADDAVPFLSTDEGVAANAMRDVMGAAFKLMGLQVTGGSSSVPDSFTKLREAGAVARETLKAAAARETGIDAAQLTTAHGAVVFPDGRTMPYTALAATAATLTPVRRVTLRPPSEWRLIGKAQQRLDIVPKSTGTLTFGIDLAVDGMKHATVKVNPRRSAMRSYDATPALAMRGVQAVVPVTNGVAVIADNTWRAFRAADAITCDWAPAAYPAEQEAHWKEVAASFSNDRLDKTWRDDGDVDAALGAEAISAEYRAPYLAHAPLEPLSAIVKVTDDRVDVWVSHQFPRLAQEKVAAITGHRVDAVHVHNQYAGGSFGHRLEFENVTLAAEIANQVRGTPIKLTFRREMDFALDFPRQIGMARGTGRVENGRIAAMALDIATVSSSRSQFGRAGVSVPGPDMQIVAGAWNLPYDIPAFRVRGYAVPELAPTSSWRSVGASTAGFFADSFIDELCHAAGADPLAERIRLTNDPVARAVLEEVGKMSNWGTPLGEGRGRGVAFVNSFGVPVAEVVEVTNTPQGIRIDRVFVAADVGRVVDPVNFDNQVKGGVVWGLGHAMNCEITYKDGVAQQSNFPAFDAMRLHQCPEIVVRGLENGPKVRGVGEPPVPPAAPALANAIFAATGQRIREMPFRRHVTFV